MEFKNKSKTSNKSKTPNPQKTPQTNKQEVKEKDLCTVFHFV